MLVRVESNRFVAGLTVQNGVVALAAPILRRVRWQGAFYYPVGKPWSEVEAVLRDKGWEIHVVKDTRPR